jgi:lysozyme family protein
MADLDRAQTVAILRALGWRIRTTGEGIQAVRLFQRGWNLGKALDVDGVVGPHTSAALVKSYGRHKAGRGDASEHFSFSEFKCHCGGRFSSCARIWTARELIVSLEAEREHEGAIHIVSGCRCPGYNASISAAATQSQHMKGTAADYGSSFTMHTVAQRHLFSGIGYAQSNSAVKHVDVRSSASRTNPATWSYPQW